MPVDLGGSNMLNRFRSQKIDVRGLTLIELVVVLAILAVLAGMIVPQLDFLKNQASYASSASNANELGRMLQTYKSASSTGTYPALDSLIDSTNNAAATWAMGSITFLNATTLSSSYASSLLNGGVRYAIPIKTGTISDASDAFDGTVAPTDLYTAVTTSGMMVATVTQTGGAPYNGDIYKAIYPGTITASGSGGSVNVTLPTSAAGTMLVAMGIGPQNGMLGNLMTTVPLDTQLGDDTKTVYSRYIAIFIAFSSGKPARLMMVTDHRGKQIGKLVTQYSTLGL
jgi:prepilin-type N-terminal cleavage/methylation domain-containing protein